MFPRYTSEAGHVSFSFLEEILQQSYNTCFCEIRRHSFSLHSHFHFSFVCCVLGVNPASGSRCSNKQQVLLSPAAERGWGRVPKLSQCALTARLSGNTLASEKWWLEMHLSSRVGYFKHEEWIVSDLKISLQVGHSSAMHDGIIKYWE